MTTAATEELDRQVRRLHELGYPELAGISPGELDALVAPLADALPDLLPGLPSDGRTTAGTTHVAGAEQPPPIPFVLVVTSRLVPTVAAVHAWSVRGRTGFTDMADELAGYRPIEGVAVPDAPVYLLLDVSTGPETLNVRPDDALPMIRAAGRTPLTIDEGVALVTQLPDVFASHNAFQALASRDGSRRVPSFWFSKGAPRLGWCWAGNPHTWLGAASASRRLPSA